MPSKRRRFLKAVGTGSIVGVSGCIGNLQGGGPDEVNIGLAVPQSGPFSYNGGLVKLGAEFGIEEINNNGGIESLGGADVNLISVDSGETADSATTAAQDLLGNNDVVAGMGCWLSSQTLGATAVAERQQVPWITISYSDKITQRGFEYVFRTSPMSSQLAKQALDQPLRLAEEIGEPVTKVGMVGDNTAAIEFAFKPLRETYIPQKSGVEKVVDETWTPTLSDATPVIQKVKDEDPGLLFVGWTATSDGLAILQKMEELNVDIPIMSVGVTGAPLLDNIGPDLIDGLLAVTGSHPLKGQEDIVRRFTDFSDEPFMIQDSISAYAHVYIVKEALEQTGSTDPIEIRDAIAEMELTSGPAVNSFPQDTLAFDEKGDRIDAEVVIVQWQETGDADFIESEAGIFTVFPEKYAMREVQWGR